MRLQKWSLLQMTEMGITYSKKEGGNTFFFLL